MRFEIRNGRFGAYFYDTLAERDVDLNQALDLMNKYADLMTIGDQLGGILR